MEIHMLDVADLEVKGEWDWVVTYYKVGSYEGDGEAVFYKDGKVAIVNLSHCSCHGPGSDEELNYNYTLEEFFDLPITEFNNTEILDGIQFALSEREPNYGYVDEFEYTKYYKEVYEHKNKIYLKTFLIIENNYKNWIEKPIFEKVNSIIFSELINLEELKLELL